MADEKIQDAPQSESLPASPPLADGEVRDQDKHNESVRAEAPSASSAVKVEPPPAPGVATAEPAKPPKKEAASEPKDVMREIAETVVFVIVLVLMLKTFIAEAFVIPTGSMATTLWGYQKVVTCPQCDYVFPVNASEQVEHSLDVLNCTCPNCLETINFTGREDPPWNSGDRVLVFKAWFDSGLPGTEVKRQDVVVFKYPVGPQKQNQGLNYIKRLIGLPGETIAIHGGQLYVYDQPRANPPPPPKSEKTGQPIYWCDEYPPGEPDRPRKSYPWPDDPEAQQLFKAGQFTIIRKSPDKIMAMRRIVYDNDHQARDRAGPALARWQGEGAWKPNDANFAKTFSHAGGGDGGIDWLRYRNLLRGSNEPQLIHDILGYNRSLGSNWVGDLMLECDVQVDQPRGELILELRRAANRFQARFDLASGQCKLFRLPKDGPEQELDQKATPVKGPGSYHLVFANFDERLTLWVNDQLPFGDGVAYNVRRENGSDNANDLKPASIGAKGASLTVSHIQLWRDTFYTTGHGDPLQTLYIYPGHYLCMGDNSVSSSDGRNWGMVPDRLMLGRALMVYFPFKFPGWLPVNRVGVIH